jgi:hypothetical protein
MPTPKAPLKIMEDFLCRTDVWLRIGLCSITTLILYIVMFGWEPAFEYRTGMAPLRDLNARTSFEFADNEATADERDRARSKVLCYYENNQLPLAALRLKLINDVFEIKQMEINELDNKFVEKFMPTDSEATDKQTPPAAEELTKFKTALEKDPQLDNLKQSVDTAFLEVDKNGLLKNLEHELGQGSMEEIQVYPRGNAEDSQHVDVEDVRIAQVVEGLNANLVAELRKNSEFIDEPEFVASLIMNYLTPQLPVTLTLDEDHTSRERRIASRNVETVMKQYEPGEPLKNLNHPGDKTVISAFEPLDDYDIEVLRAEYEAHIESMTIQDQVLRSFSFFGLFASVFALFSGYLYFRDHELLADIKQFCTLLALMLITWVGAWLLSINVQWRWELVPLTLFAMTIAIVYHIELSIFLSALVALAFTVAHGFSLSEFVVLTASCSTAALLCRSIRSRTKLVYVGLVSAIVVLPTVVGVNYMLGQPMSGNLWVIALCYAGSAGFAGLCMTALLPFMESWFDVQTDICLLELSDANHPLLKDLVQRAPGTYNHSINIASISEAAADAIGANGLLCRVGAYFHDIGKLRKPEYFIENQSGGANKHDELLPTMSTLVIIAHVKEGAEIARIHRLPQRIIDLIEQHHGTTLVEYFYNRAAQQSREDENGAEIDEKDYRYPGPKPQTPEAAVMMLADAVESASRALREPTPSRIENLVNEIAKKRLDDGQFDECNITLQQLHTIQESLIKSLNGMYHARVKYPDQQSA